MVSNKCLYAMYVIGSTESSGKWDAINYNDPITVGIMQWFGTRAAALLNLLKPQWGSIAASLRSDLESHPPGDGGFWPYRRLTKVEGESLRPILSSEAGKLAQQETWEDDYNGNVQILGKYGFSEDRPQPLILLMSALHQSPKRAHNIAHNYGGASSLDRIYAAIKAEPVLGKYMTYRYTPSYNMLKNWDGVSGPPASWGGVVGELPPPGDGDVPPPLPDDPADDPTDGIEIRHVEMSGDHLILVGKSGRTMLYRDSMHSWTPQNKKAIIPPPSAPDIPDPEPPPPGDDTPPSGGGTAWTHPCPARVKVSSPSTWENPSRQNHRGVDFAGPIGTPIYSVDDGVVIKAGASSGFGYAVGIRHPSGLATGYGHMDISQILVKVGDTVKKGQRIAGVHTRGQSSGPHLHFEVYGGGKWASGHIWPEKALRDHGVTKL